MEFNVAAVTFRVVLADTDPEVTVIVVEPTPVTVAVFPTRVATAGLLDVHVPPPNAEELPSDKWAVAEKVSVAGEAGGGTYCNVGLSGKMVMLVSTAAETVAVTFCVCPPHAAEIAEEPVATPVSRPVELIVASEVVADFQSTLEVRSCEEPSE
jgi:hypothetical protein